MVARTTTTMAQLHSCWLLLIVVSTFNGGVKGQYAATVPCNETSDCFAADLGDEFECRFGRCSNNPYEQGCLYSANPLRWKKKRICNSDDVLPAAEECGICRTQATTEDFLEIRLASQNWETVFFEDWLLQILLSEILDVPTSIETGKPDAFLNFYDPTSPFDYGILVTKDTFVRTYELGGDCTKSNRDADPNNYQDCAHFIPEKWDDLNAYPFRQLIDDGIVESVGALGALGEESWFVPKFTVQRDPTLTNYIGLQGPENRRKLAETFLRPTSWKQYCQEVSLNNCTSDDGVAKRPPQTETEQSKYFVDGLYIGHFRATDKNDCDRFPDTCTGHFADYPCDWTSDFVMQSYQLDIALERDGPELYSNGYSYSQLTEIWAAANWTKSNVIMIWFTPNPTFQTFLGTDADFMRVNLPTTTKQCMQAKTLVDDEMLCSNNVTAKQGTPLGTCGRPSTLMQKVVSSKVYDLVYDPKIPDGLRSPAYDLLKQFTLSELDLGELLQDWLKEKNPRQVTCDWVIKNYQQVQRLIPDTYPRVFVDQTDNKPLLYTALAMAIVSLFLVLLTSYKVYQQRERKVMQTAQIEFLFLLLAGSFCISLASAILVIPPVNATCTSVQWLVNLGYTLELVPLIVRISAINHLMNAARSLRRVKVRKTTLFGSVALVSTIIVIFLIVWTIVDPPRQEQEYKLTDSLTSDGETIVLVGQICKSITVAWSYASVSWNALLLLGATVLAFQTRSLRHEYNESQTLGIMIYSHFVFVILRILTYALDGHASDDTLSKFQSLIFSSDTIATVVIYFLPKFLAKDPASIHFGSSFPMHRVEQSEGTQSCVLFGHTPTPIPEAAAEIAPTDSPDARDTMPSEILLQNLEESHFMGVEHPVDKHETPAEDDDMDDSNDEAETQSLEQNIHHPISSSPQAYPTASESSDANQMSQEMLFSESQEKSVATESPLLVAQHQEKENTPEEDSKESNESSR